MNSLLKKLAVVVTLSVAVIASEGYKDNDILISPEDAIKLIGDPNVMFVSGDSGDIYKLGHIKGSVEMYAHHLQHSDIAGNAHCTPLFRCLDDAEHYIGSKGITNDMMIIAYDDFKGPNATGVYFFFKSYGHKNIKVLNGGRAGIMALDPAQKEYDAVNKKLKAEKKVAKKAKKKLKKAKKGEIELTKAQSDELKAVMKASKAKQKVIKAELDGIAKNLLVVKGDEHTTAKKYHINKDDLDFSYIAGKEELKHAMEDILKNGKDSKYVIIDTRGMSEIIGERKMDNVARGGHIPGSTLLEWKKISDLENRRSFKDADQLQAVFDHYDITPDKTIYAYCQVGAGRSTEIITALKLLGYKNVKSYSGSWNQWGNDMNLPIKR
ncbi:MAG: rhodanese-like domain-containing protein [Campylobacterota bacterium]|nr:rhodanese-like domain-containing protein [Campylobacterota bacterium]